MENVSLRKRDEALAARVRHGRKEGLTSSISRESLLNAVRHEGREILTSEGGDYWKDMQRKYPHLNVGGRPTDTGDNAAGTANRFGRISERVRYRGKLRMVWDAKRGEWVEKPREMKRLKRELGE